MDGTRWQVGIRGQINGYDLVTLGNLLQVKRGGAVLVVQVIVGLAAFVARARDLRLGWGEFPDFEVIYLYDHADGNYGYAVNLKVEAYSEWGYAPFES